MSELFSRGGERQVCLSVAGMVVALSCADDMPQQVVGPMGQFVVEEIEGRPDITINTRWGHTRSADGGDLLFDSGSIWRLYAMADNGFEFRLAAPFSDWRPYKLARFNGDWTRGEIVCEKEYFERGASVYPLEYPLDEVLFSNLLARGRGIEIHGCGLSDRDGNGYLFAGQSGAGKSTMARLWNEHGGARILSDERVIIRRAANGEFYMYGTPWHGDAGITSACSAPLTKVFFLGRGLENELVPQSKAEAAARLFACSFPPFYSFRGISFTLEFLDELTQQVDCDELKFVPDESVIQFILEQSPRYRTTQAVLV